MWASWPRACIAPSMVDVKSRSVSWRAGRPCRPGRIVRRLRRHRPCHRYGRPASWARTPSGQSAARARPRRRPVSGGCSPISGRRWSVGLDEIRRSVRASSTALPARCSSTPWPQYAGTLGYRGGGRGATVRTTTRSVLPRGPLVHRKLPRQPHVNESPRSWSAESTPPASAGRPRGPAAPVPARLTARTVQVGLAAQGGTRAPAGEPAAAARVNEALLSTLDPHGVLEMIADSLRSVVSCDTLGLVVDWDAGVRRAVVAP